MLKLKPQTLAEPPPVLVVDEAALAGLFNAKPEADNVAELRTPKQA